MSVGWAGDDAVFETAESTINDAIDWVRLDLQKAALRESNTHCDDCDNLIPLGRRQAVPGVLYCIHCQAQHDDVVKSGYNRRGSKDSQLR